MIEPNRIYCENNLDTMARMPDGFVDLTVTSPPYDNLRTYNGFVFDFESVAKELYRVTKQGGVVVWVVNDATVNGSETGTSFRQALYFKEIGFNLHDTMIYAKKNYIPLTHNRYEQAFEYIFILAKGKPKTFYPIMVGTKEPGKYINRNRTNRANEGSTRNRNESTVIKSNKIHCNIFEYTIGIRTDNGTHPAVFPESLANDHILSWSNPGDLVYDPFSGSGTTARMAMINGRNYIGSEISEEYVKLSEKRIREHTGLFIKEAV